MFIGALNRLGSISRSIKPPKATAANALGPFSFPSGVAITPIDVESDFTLNGNTLTYSISPDLPTGLSLNSTTGVISGTPA